MNQGEKFWRSPPHFQRRAALSEARELRWAGTTANILALFWKKKTIWAVTNLRNSFWQEWRSTTWWVFDSNRQIEEFDGTFNDV